MVKKPSGNKRRFNNRNYIRKNDKIRAREVRVIGADGEMLGVMPRKKPSRSRNLVVWIWLRLLPLPLRRFAGYSSSENTSTSSVRISETRKKTAKRIKEAKFRPRIEEHDYVTKLRRSEKFLHQGNKLKITLMFRGREMEHIDLGMNLVKQAIKDLSGVGKADDTPKLSGRFIIVNLSPLPKNQRVLRYNSLEEAEVEEQEDPEEDDLGSEENEESPDESSS